MLQRWRLSTSFPPDARSSHEREELLRWGENGDVFPDVNRCPGHRKELQLWQQSRNHSSFFLSQTPQDTAAVQRESLTHNLGHLTNPGSSDGYMRRHSNLLPSGGGGQTESTSRLRESPLPFNYYIIKISHTMTKPLAAIVPHPRRPPAAWVGSQSGSGGPEDPLPPHTLLGHFTECVHWYVQLITPFTLRLLSPHSFMSPLLQPVTSVDLHQLLHSDFQTEENGCQILSASSEALQKTHQHRNPAPDADNHRGVWMQPFPRSANVI